MQPLSHTETLQQIKNLNQMLEKVLEACPELTYIGNPILRKKAEEVTLLEGRETAIRLRSVLGRYRVLTGFGRGLAAPQIGESKAVFVTYVSDVFKTYMNPRITKASPEQNYFWEACLSCGFISVDVKRPEAVRIEYMDETGDTIDEPVDGFLARLIQHELDHLEGVVNVDKAEKGAIDFMTSDPLKQTLRQARDQEKPSTIMPPING